MTGFTGAGKSTAIDCVVNAGIGERVYLGQIVLDAIAGRGLDNTGENQRLVRTELRQIHGEDYLFAASCPRIDAFLSNGRIAMVDAVLSAVENSYLRQRYPEAYRLVHVQAPLAMRAERLLERSLGKTNLDDVMKRDQLEREKLEIEVVFNCADLRIDNDGTYAQLLERLMAGLSLFS